MVSNATITCSALTIRVFIALFTRTFFQPDEYFQSLEIAHRLVFGYGHLTWEWLAPNPIRSIIYPAFSLPIYWLLKVSGLAGCGTLGNWLLIACPKVLHGVMAAGTDIWLSKLVRTVLGEAYVSTAVFVSFTSFFHALSLSRSLSNSLETTLTTIAFAYYPWGSSSSRSPHVFFNRPNIRKTIIFSVLACMVRPTNGVIWVFLYTRLLWVLRLQKKMALTLTVEILLFGASALFILFSLDSLYYGKPTFTPLNFLLTNLSSVSLFYGFNSWHYYFSQAIPILCTTSLPFTLHGIWATFSKNAVTGLKTGDSDTRAKNTRIDNLPLTTMLATLIWSIGVYSLAGHKEWRFIHPLLPIFHMFAVKSLVDLSHGCPDLLKTLDSAKNSSRSIYSIPPIRKRYFYLILLNIPVAVYTMLFYCSAPIAVMSFINTLPAEELQQGIGFLMPCHSTPGHAYLHREDLTRGAMWALGCEPPLGGEDLAAYRDQTDVFLNSPRDYMGMYFPQDVDSNFPQSPYPNSIPGQPNYMPVAGVYQWKHEWPRYLVFFGHLLKQEGIQALLDEKGYIEIWKEGPEWQGEGSRKGGVRVWKWVSDSVASWRGRHKL